MNKEALYELAEKEHISVFFGDFSAVGSMSVDYGENGVIGMDNSLSGSNETEHLAHEMGHCIKKAFYHPYELPAVRGKMEKKAEEWAVLQLIPLPLLRSAMSSGSELWQIAEELGYSERFVRSAFEVYRAKQMI